MSLGKRGEGRGPPPARGSQMTVEIWELLRPRSLRVGARCLCPSGEGEGGGGGGGGGGEGMCGEKFLCAALQSAVPYDWMIKKEGKGLNANCAKGNLRNGKGKKVALLCHEGEFHACPEEKEKRRSHRCACIGRDKSKKKGALWKKSGERRGIAI